MPKVPMRKQLVQLALLFGYESINEPDTAISDEDDTLPFIQLLLSKRYLLERSSVPKSIHWSELAFFSEDYDDNRFRSQFRMTRDSFLTLLQLIGGHDAFNETQDPIILQVGIALYRLGTFGNAASIQHVATKFGISEGNVANFTERTIAAITSISGNWIRWPEKNERNRIGSDMATKGLPKCIGFVDGTDITLAKAPLKNKEVYWSRKKKYCLQAQIICDPQMRVRDFYIGYPGSVHDAKVFMASPIGANPNRFFTEGEFIIGDSAYALTEHVIVPFRKPQTGLSQDLKSFNYRLSEHRVLVENAICLLKARFQSLRGLRIRVNDSNNGHKRSCDWTHACVVLHNMLVNHDPWDTDEEHETMEENEHQPELFEGNINTNKRGQLKRLALFEIHKAMNITY